MLTKPTQMTSLTEVLEMLRLRKQDYEFKMTEEGFTAGKGKLYKSEDLTIIKTYRFEGESDPADSSILYVIEANDGMMGYSMDQYGASSNQDNKYDEFIRQVKMEDRDEQILFGE